MVASEIEKDFVLKNYADLFRGFGKFEKKYTIQLKEGFVLTAKPARRVPQAIIGKLKDKLNELKENKIIAEADEYSECIHNLVVVAKKDKNLRLCLDPYELNID